jgi:hypothetical protein
MGILGHNESFSAPAHQPYLPQDGAVVFITSEHSSELFMKTVTDFAEQHKLPIERSDILKQGRNVVKIRINVGKDSFFDLDNIRDTDQMVISAYSHEDKAIWKQTWRALVEDITYSIGRENVFVIRSLN